MSIRRIYLSDQDEKRLKLISQELKREEAELLDAAVSEAITRQWVDAEMEKRHVKQWETCPRCTEPTSCRNAQGCAREGY